MQQDTLREKTCFFTGHRDIPRDRYAQIQQQLEQAVITMVERGIHYFGCGGALGFDTIAAMTVLKLKRQYPQIRLVLILPCKNHDFSWQGEDKEIFEQIRGKADKVVYTSEKYYSGCMYKRNRHMADGSGWCICYMERPAGGTAYTVSYAKSVGVRILNLANHMEI